MSTVYWLSDTDNITILCQHLL